MESIVVNEEIERMALSLHVKIISDSIIYKLFDQYKQYVDQLNPELRQQHPNIVKPFRLMILPEYIFIKKQPILFGVRVMEGSFAVGMVVEAAKDNVKLLLGKIVSIQKNKKIIERAGINEEVCIKIESGDPYEYGKHFDHTWSLYNFMTDEDRLLLKNYPDVFY